MTAIMPITRFIPVQSRAMVLARRVEAVAQITPDPDQEANWPKFGRKISEAPTDVVQPRLPSTGLMAQVLGDQSLDACLDAAQAARAYRRSQGLLAARLSRLDVRGI
ncbi:MAG TPA: hypothetical protein DCL54_00805 [Alphaproteobacteria bacterium]|nr:hypothetical protein [Alphaproteobacteria bacterium]